MEKEQKLEIFRIVITAAALAAAMLLPLNGAVKAVVFGAVYLFSAWDVLLSAFKNILHCEIFDEEFLMAIASLGAFCIGEYPESVAVMLFFRIGELFEELATERSRRSVSDLMDIRPDTAVVIRDGGEAEVRAEEVAVGETILVRPGERVPLDGIVISGETELNTMDLTGESLPRSVSAGEEVLSGCVNISGAVFVRVTKAFGDSTASKILDLVENSAENKAESESFIARFAKYYTPAVVSAAVILGVIIPIFAGNWSAWIYRALVFLVTSCPCALVVSVPLGFFCGIGNASKRGVLVKGSNYLEVLGKCTAVAFDKTGTLTKGSFSIKKFIPPERREELSMLAAAAEQYSNHPIARAVTENYGGELPEVTDVEEIAGHGVTAKINGARIAVGNLRLMEREGAVCAPAEEPGTAVYVAKDGRCVGCILLGDTVKEEAREAVAAMKRSGIRLTVMLTGDRRDVAEQVGRTLGIDTVISEMLPGDKAAKIEEIIACGETLAYVGDGLNDAPAIRRADVGIAMGALGSDAAIEAADVVLMDDDIRKISSAVAIARKTGRIVRENIVFSIGAKFAVLILSALGITGMWTAVFADVGVLIIAVLNAIRGLKA